MFRDITKRCVVEYKEESFIVRVLCVCVWPFLHGCICFCDDASAGSGRVDV